MFKIVLISNCKTILQRILSHKVILKMKQKCLSKGLNEEVVSIVEVKIL